MMVEQLFIKTLDRNKLFKTTDRMTLFRILKNHTAPCSISKLIELSSDQMNMTTVYRNIELFEKIGVISRVYTGWKYKIELSDKYSSHHHHMTCENCENIISFKESHELQRELKKIEKKYGFRTESHSLELIGICNKCLRRRSKATFYA